MNTPNFDNIILSENAFAGLVHALNPSENTLGMVYGVKIIPSQFVPENKIILRQGDIVVAIIQFRDEAQQ